MSTDTRQRRGKTSSTAAAPASSSESALTPEDQIRKAEATILQNKETTERLYTQWRIHLKRISFLVVIMAFHQAQAPMSDCISDIKAVNATIDGNTVTWTQAIALVMYESMCEIVGVLLATCLCVFLSMDPPGDFSSTPYMLSSAMVPLDIGLYYQTRRIGCVGDFDLVNIAVEDRTRRFPVAVVFHTMTTGAYWFMQYGRNEADKNMRQLDDLKRQLKDARKDAKSRKK